MVKLLIGHRGLPTLYPENTMPSFQGALDNGADGFETDLQITSVDWLYCVALTLQGWCYYFDA